MLRLALDDNVATTQANAVSCLYSLVRRLPCQVREIPRLYVCVMGEYPPVVRVFVGVIPPSLFRVIEQQCS